MSGHDKSITTDQSASRIFYQRMVEGDNEFSRDREIVPAPLIDMNFETFYANESIIGYTYNVTLTGYAASKQDRNDDGHPPSIGHVVGSIARIKGLFDDVGNGGKLIIKKPYENNPMMIFKGGRIKSINFAPSSNQWVQYSEYTIILEFHDVELYGCNFDFIKGCNREVFDNITNVNGDINLGSGDVSSDPEESSTAQKHLVDFSKHKIKSFNDNWNINLADEIYDFTKVDNNSGLELNNKRYTVEYTVSATGQHYWDDEGKLFPAWKQAKAFCQDKLVKQINGFYNNLALHYSGPEHQYCGSQEDITQIHRIDQPTIHNTIGPMNVFNETITVNPSESDGTCSLTYSSIVKTGKESCVTTHDTIHNMNISFQGVNECGKTRTAKTVNLSGNIQGLLKGNGQGSIIWPNSEGFRIPDDPNQILLICHKDTANSKWRNAKALLDRFINDGTGAVECTDLCNVITAGIEGYEGDECKTICANSCVKPGNFNITHNYNAGTIDYNLEFTYDGNNRQNFCNITISTEEPVPITAEFTIPGRGLYYQPLGGCTPRKWSINAEGRIQGYDNITCADLSEYLSVCGLMPVGCAGLIPPDNGYLLTAKQQTFNPIDGSFSYNASYVCTICPGGNCN